MSYFFKKNNFNLENYEFDIEIIPKFTKKEKKILKILIEKSDLRKDYSKINLEKIGYKTDLIKQLSQSLLRKIISCYVINNKNERFDINFNIFDFIIFENFQMIYKFSNEVKNSRTLGNFFTRINLLAILKFEFPYTKKLYKKIIKYNKKRGMLEYTLEEFKNILEIKSDTYSRFYNLENKVLNPIIKDLELAEINIWFEKIKNTPAKTSRVIGVKVYYVNQPISNIHKDTNKIIKIYSNEIKDFSKAYNLIYNFKKFNTFEKTISYVEENKTYLFSED